MINVHITVHKTYYFFNMHQTMTAKTIKTLEQYLGNSIPHLEKSVFLIRDRVNMGE